MTKNKVTTVPARSRYWLVITFSDGITTLPTQGFWLRYQLNRVRSGNSYSWYWKRTCSQTTLWSVEMGIKINYGNRIHRFLFFLSLIQLLVTQNTKLAWHLSFSPSVGWTYHLSHPCYFNNTIQSGGCMQSTSSMERFLLVFDTQLSTTTNSA